ncbi:LOW QUALITY PROTEIN: two pore channel protein 2-like [Haliotis rubra]|uniref:LOW QUALITY PROTEIN: two pore channel protein 2-like n=1 Tax=Haliotis rubra TaxID=36100 RepID=UPI001EE50D83|nr:LOW QUALITY PROTEIN: two pore channel protein 2-like [Haliotis rubra]
MDIHHRKTFDFEEHVNLSLNSGEFGDGSRSASSSAVESLPEEGRGGDSPSESVRGTTWYIAPSLTEVDSAANEAHDQFAGLDLTTILQAVVFIEDAYKYRSICHKLEIPVLHLYRSYLSTPVEIFRYIVIFVLHILVIFEYPSSLTMTSDIRFRGNRIAVPCWLTEGIEVLCLLLLLADTIIRGYVMGKYYFWRHKWLVAGSIIIAISLLDWSVSVALGCHEYIRFRRILRPFFLLQNSTIMKKTVNCLRRTLPEVASVLALLGLHIYLFTLFGMLLFPKIEVSYMLGTLSIPKYNTADPLYKLSKTQESKYFRTLLDSFMSLLVLLTTANNPDVTMPAYQNNRLYSLFFILFLVIGLYCFMNMLTAVIYNQFRGYFLNSMQASFFRRRLGVRAAFEVLRRRKLCFRHNSCLPSVGIEVGAPVVKAVVQRAFLSKSVKQALLQELMQNPQGTYSATEFQTLFEELEREHRKDKRPDVHWYENPILRRIQRVFVHNYFSYFGSVIAVANVIVISIQLATRYGESISSSHSLLRVTNFTFVIYYFVEQTLKVWATGPRRYIYYYTNIFDALITLALVVGEIFTGVEYGFPYSSSTSTHATTSKLWNTVRFINILIMVRLFRIIPHIKATSVIASTLIDLVKNLKAFAGILVVIYYSFAIVGMELFHDVIKYQPMSANKNDTNSSSFHCGSYQQLEYWANNFDDFAASVVVLWDIMVVNNWMVFLAAFKQATSAWAYLFFIAWWLLTVVIVLNLFTALILENFIMKWDKILHTSRDRSESGHVEEASHLMSVHEMFRGLLQEPAENELLVELTSHRYLQLDR